MSPLIKGSAKVKALSAEELSSRADMLAGALESGEGLLEPEAARRAQEVVTKVRERSTLVGGHTVVALAGATGSGKSSLFNTLVGAKVAEPGTRRPTTSTPTAAVWGDEPAGALLDWLGVGRRHQMEEKGELDGLVLLDLPDFDSRESANRAEARRVLELADVFVWVTDPQKYADAVLHDDYVAALKDYGAVTVMVLNQADRLSEEGVQACVADLSRLLVRDGLEKQKVIATSTVTGLGIDELRHRLHTAVASADAARHRLGADVATAARSLSSGVGSSEPDEARLGTPQLVDALARAAGVPTVVDAVERDFRMEAWARTGWPFTRWVRAFRPAPLKRLRLDHRDDGGPSFDEADVRAVLGRSSIPPPTPSARAAVDLAARQVGDRGGQGLPPRWAMAVADAADPDDTALADALDQAVVRTPLRARNPLWWTVFGALQVVLALAAVVGLLWLVAIGVAGWLQLPALPTVDVGPFATPFLLLVGGLLGGLLLAALARWMARIGARRRASVIDRRLRGSIADVAEAQVIDPVVAVLRRHARTRSGLEGAGRAG